MSRLRRRTFLQSAAATVTVATVGRAASSPNEKVNVAVLGCGRGSNLASWFAQLPDSQVVAICDVDESRGNALAARIGASAGRTPATKEPNVTADVRATGSIFNHVNVTEGVLCEVIR